MTIFEEMVEALVNQGRKETAKQWINSLFIKDEEKVFLIETLVNKKFYKEISYNGIDLSISNLSRFKKKAIKSANNSIKLSILNNLR